MASASQVDIADQVLALDKHPLSEEEARQILCLRFPKSDLDRMNELAGKARAGLLTKAEEAELDSYLHTGNRLGMLQSRARQLLKESSLGS